MSGQVNRLALAALGRRAPTIGTDGISFARQHEGPCFSCGIVALLAPGSPLCGRDCEVLSRVVLIASRHRSTGGVS